MLLGRRQTVVSGPYSVYSAFNNDKMVEGSLGAVRPRMGQQERNSSNPMSLAGSGTAEWIGFAFCSSLGLTTLTLATLGSGERGTDVALQITARLSGRFFLPA